MQTLRYAGPCLALALAASCGGSDPPPDALLGQVSVASQAPGPTPFIVHVGLVIERPDLVRSVSYTIAPKPGTVSRPVSVSYGSAYLARRQLLDMAGKRLDLPVFGLYAAYPNQVAVRIGFADGSTRLESLLINTASYDALPYYNAPDVRTPRQPGIALGFDFMLLKNILVTPVVIDTDGNLRWVGSGVTDAVASAFDGGRFLAGDGKSPTLYRIELDGTVSSVGLSDPSFADFHHDLAPGKTGLLAEVDRRIDGVLYPGTVLAEIDADGRVLKQWDLSAIFRAAMLAGGDDPSGLVRDQADWFHMNSAIHDRADDALLVSSRENFVVKLDYESGRIRWLLGDPEKYWYQAYPSLRALALKLSSGKPPVGQHALSIAPDGTLMLFNNGTASMNQPPGAPAGSNPGFSAVSRYAIDEAAGTAAEVWTYEHGRDTWADVCSSAYQVREGGSLIDYASAYGRTRARLVGLDANGRLAFDYEYPTMRCDTIFNAAPIDFGALVLD
ncbi:MULTISPECIES: aryl-sulfate sulfotransferase [unclassified Massilia]|uniref:aryl-sulfate sulfotransferase n=1 Tax=unclassified Massilia TaxID=2609279 RepID=UPI000A5E7CC5|nr:MULTISPECIES: aryl-sulfate sulfotransferase [unclassified Massilia]